MSHPNESEVFALFRLSYMWITPVGITTVLSVGILTSFLTGKTDLKTLDPELISPLFQWILPREAQRYAGSAIRKARDGEHKFESEQLIRLQIIGTEVKTNDAPKPAEGGLLYEQNNS